MLCYLYVPCTKKQLANILPKCFIKTFNNVSEKCVDKLTYYIFELTFYAFPQYYYSIQLQLQPKHYSYSTTRLEFYTSEFHKKNNCLRFSKEHTTVTVKLSYFTIITKTNPQNKNIMFNLKINNGMLLMVINVQRTI